MRETILALAYGFCGYCLGHAHAYLWSEPKPTLFIPMRGLQDWLIAHGWHPRQWRRK